MDPNTRALIMGAGGGAAAEKIYVEDVFSTWLYTGNGSTGQTITNGIDLSGKGGLVWMKSRTAAQNHWLFDTARGAQYGLVSSGTFAQIDQSNGFSSFNSNGFSLGSGIFTGFNGSGEGICSWTFREQAKFFDVVTWTGNGSTQTINHSLGSVPGCIIVKRTNFVGNWYVYHRSIGTPQANYLQLNTTDSVLNDTSLWNNTAPTSTSFSVGSSAINEAAYTYVAYLFAHDAGGFGDSGNDSVVSCGSFTTNGSGNATVNLGWEPQFVIAKLSSTTSDWFTFDAMRGFIVQDSGSRVLSPNQSFAEYAQGAPFVPTSTGFTLGGGFGVSQTGIYIAIRRGPMKTPTDATKVYTTATQGSAGDSLAPGYRSTFPVDFAFWTVTNSAGSNRRVMSRMQGINGMYSDLTNAEASFGASYKWDYQNGFWDNTGTGTTNRAWMFRRAPGFFDAVCYTGTGSARTVSHNLGVAPELMIVKQRSASNSWLVYSSSTGADKYLILDGQNQAATSTVAWNNTLPTATVFSLNNFANVNASGGTYIAYLFATLTGISKVGSYTGTGTTLNVDCGFTNGARFVLIKRTDSTGDWYVWDTARGIVSGNDPYLLLNSTAAEVTNTDFIDPLSSGFQISSTAPAAVNANGGSFIYLAIA